MEFQYDARTEELRTELLDFMDSHVHPAEQLFHDQLADLDDSGDRWAWDRAPVMVEKSKCLTRVPSSASIT